MKIQTCLAAKSLLNKALQAHKEHARLSEQSRACKIKGAEDFGEGCHTALTEPHFYDSAYKPVKRGFALPIDECGKCVLASEITADDKTSKARKNQPMKSTCTNEYKPFTDAEVHGIVDSGQLRQGACIL